MKARAHVIASGRVQGVFFRSRTKSEADNRKVKGWICNRGDGGVEAVFEGEEEAVKAMIEIVKRGPLDAKVTKISVVLENYAGEFEKFDIKHQAQK